MQTEEALSTQLRKEHLAWLTERARGVRMKNDEAEGLLLPAHEVKAKLSQAALRSEGGRRRLGVPLRRCAAMGAGMRLWFEFDGATNATITAVRGALEAN